MSCNRRLPKMTETIENTHLSPHVTRQIDASPEAVFDAWLDPKMLMQFMKPGEGMTCPRRCGRPG